MPTKKQHFVPRVYMKAWETLDVGTSEGKEYVDELMTGIWYSELYKMFFKNKGGFYHNVVQLALSGLEALKADKNYSKISIQLTSEELDVLVGRIYEYTLKLASDNEIEIAADDFEEEKDVIKNLQSYLKVQRRIFAEAA